MLCGLNTRSTANNILRVSMSLKLAVTVLFWVINRMEFGRLAVVVEAAGIIGTGGAPAGQMSCIIP